MGYRKWKFSEQSLSLSLSCIHENKMLGILLLALLCACNNLQLISASLCASLVVCVSNLFLSFFILIHSSLLHPKPAIDCLQYMINGTTLIKVKASMRQYRRFHTLEEDLSMIRWVPSTKKTSKARCEYRMETKHNCTLTQMPRALMAN